MIRNALLLSDIHLGWVPCTPAHRELLDHLPAAADDAELIVLNGDIIDGHREVHAPERELVDRLVAQCAQWRREGRTVIYIEGNHDPDPSPLGDPVWSYTFDVGDGGGGERVLVLHGHRFDGAPFHYSEYERIGRRAIAFENAMYARSRTLRRLYERGGGWIAGAWGYAEDRLWRPRFPAQLAPLLDGIDTIAHGHYHFGAGHSTDLGRPAWRTGAWVARGHFGTVDRMLRYRDGRWERIALDRGRWRATADGR